MTQGAASITVVSRSMTTETLPSEALFKNMDHILGRIAARPEQEVLDNTLFELRGLIGSARDHLLAYEEAALALGDAITYRAALDSLDDEEAVFTTAHLTAMNETKLTREEWHRLGRPASLDVTVAVTHG